MCLPFHACVQSRARRCEQSSVPTLAHRSTTCGADLEHLSTHSYLLTMPTPSVPLEATFPGDAAIIRTEVSDFAGAGFTLPPRSPPATLKGPTAYVIEIPARVGFTVADMTTFGPAKPGGGGVGMALDLFSKTYVSVSMATGSPNERKHAHEACTVVHGVRTPILEHHVAVFRACLKAIWIDAPVEVTSFCATASHVDAFPAHCGLGSTSGAAFGVLVGLNKCFGEPFTLEELRRVRCMLQRGCLRVMNLCLIPLPSCSV
jgi:hypothetical protein